MQPRTKVSVFDQLVLLLYYCCTQFKTIPAAGTLSFACFFHKCKSSRGIFSWTPLPRDLIFVMQQFLVFSPVVKEFSTVLLSSNIFLFATQSFQLPLCERFSLLFFTLLTGVEEFPQDSQIEILVDVLEKTKKWDYLRNVFLVCYSDDEMKAIEKALCSRSLLSTFCKTF